MANWNDRRGHRGRGPDDAREDIHQGPWSPYNGLARGRERDRYRNDDYDARTWGDRGRDYWVEDDRWEDRRMGMGDQWRHRDDDQDREELEQQWGNRMGMREEPSDRAVPRAGAWEREPRYTEMERMWSDRDDHPWSNERRATDEERREHRDYAHSLASDREHRDEYARERGGEQYPTHTRDSNDQPRNWTERTGRGAERYHDQRHEDRLRAGRDEQRALDQERFGHQEPQWLQRSYQRGSEDMYARGRDDRDMHARDMRGRNDRDMRGHDDRDTYSRAMQHRDDRDLHQTRDTRGRDDHDMRGREMYGRDMRDRQMHGRDDRDTRGHQMREMDDRDLRGRNLYRNEAVGRNDRNNHGRDEHGQDMRGRDDRDRGDHRADDRRGADHRSDDQRGDDRSSSRFSHRGDRNRYD